MISKENTNQIPFTVQGFVTDPKSIGYQILTNYECMYWRALVGNEAFSLYEVLRSFCHGEEKTCYPSIRLLCDILGLKDRRRLTGRKSTNTKADKEYKYRGLIDELQEHGLIIAEVVGEEPSTSYLFHVNLTPGLLSEKQIDALPQALQEKHGELLKRCENSVNELMAKKRISKIKDETTAKEGSGNLPGEGVAICQGGDGNLPPKQYQINNTQYNNNTEVENVVVDLIGLGFEKKLATKLVQKHGANHIKQKIEYYNFEKAQTKIKTPSRWLYKAIESNFDAPQGYDTALQKSLLKTHLEANKTQTEEADAKQAQSRRQEEKANLRAFISDRYNTSQDEITLWESSQADLKQAFAKDSTVYMAYVTNIEMLQVENEKIKLGVTSDFFVKQLAKHKTKTIIEQVLSKKLDKQVTVEFEVVKAYADVVQS